MIHRDVKPSNILLAPDGRALLGDFGVARLVDGSRLTDTRATIGTAAYLAPEQIGGGSLGPAADVYALGVVLIEALSGQPAFTGTRREMLAARTVRDPHVPAHLPAPWPTLLRAMTRRDPAFRPDAGAVAARLTRTDAADPSLETAETATLPADPGVETSPVETSQTEILAGTQAIAGIDPARARPRRAGASSSGPMSWALVALLGVLIVLGVTAAIVVAPDGGDETPASAARDTTEATVPTTTSMTPATSTTVTVPATTTPPPGGASAQAPATTCADLDARQQEIEAEKHGIDDTFRDDRDARNQRRRELDEQRRALDGQRRTLGC